MFHLPWQFCHSWEVHGASFLVFDLFSRMMDMNISISLSYDFYSQTHFQHPLETSTSFHCLSENSCVCLYFWISVVTSWFSYCELATFFFWYKASVFTGPSQSRHINSNVTVSVSYAADIWNSNDFSNYFCSFWDFSVWEFLFTIIELTFSLRKHYCKTVLANVFHQVTQKLPVVCFVRTGSRSHLTGSTCHQ